MFRFCNNYYATYHIFAFREQKPVTITQMYKCRNVHQCVTIYADGRSSRCYLTHVEASFTNGWDHESFHRSLSLFWSFCGAVKRVLKKGRAKHSLHSDRDILLIIKLLTKFNNFTSILLTSVIPLYCTDTSQRFSLHSSSLFLQLTYSVHNLCEFCNSILSLSELSKWT